MKGSTKIPASLTLGGYDQGRSGEAVKIPINDDDDRLLTIAVQNIAVTDSLQGDVELSSSAILVPIDSSVTDLWLPKSICDEFESAFGLQYNAQTNRYILESKNHTLLQKNDPVLNFTIGSQLAGGTITTIQFPYSAFDLQAGLPIFADTLNYFPIRRAANETQYMIGRVFLQEAYLTVDYERNYFNISQANYSLPTPEVNIVTIEPVNMPSNDDPREGNPSDSSKTHGLSRGIIAGIAVGSAVMIACTVGLVWYFHPKRRKRYELEAQGSEQSPHPMKSCEIMGREVGELAGDDRKAEFPGSGMVPVEIEGAEKVHEMPTPVYELPTPLAEMK